MDDLLGEDWQKPSKPTTNTAPSNPSAFASNYSGFRASPQPPLSGNTSPLNLSRPSSTVNGAKPAASDNFSNLLSLKSQKAPGNVSMQERQKQLLEEKRKQQEQQAALWDNLGSGRGTPEIRQPSPAITNQEDEDDILAAFNKDAPVNKASHFAPPPPSGVPSGVPSGAASGRSTPAMAQPVSTTGSTFGEDDDDPFGLNQVRQKSNGRPPPPVMSAGDDDDILGDLGKPVTEKPMSPPAQPSTAVTPAAETDAPQDRNLAELVDMGFPPETAKIALAETSGNVQDAVGWLIQQAHEESRSKSKSQPQRTSPSESRSPQGRQRSDDQAMPAWMRQERRPSSGSRGQESANGEKDPAQMAQEFGSKFLKSANSFWKAGQKQMAKRIAEFQQDSTADPSQPKWMRDASPAEPQQPRRREQQPSAPRQQRDMVDVTDEAAALDAPRTRPEKPRRPSKPQDMEMPSRSRQPAEPSPQRPTSQPKFMQQAPSQPDRRPTSKLSRQDVEEQTAQAYVSPARRKRPTPKPEPQPEPEVDLFSPAPAAKASAAPTPSSVPPRDTQSQPVSRPSPTPPKPKAPPRSIPQVSPSALSTSASHRKAGGEHYKRGDYGAAHESYTAALTPLPLTHPIAIIVLSNRSLTALKTGDAKTAVSDADKALEIIGPSLGAGETIDLGAEGTKEMKDFYGKALMRKAEALEHMEKYSDAVAVWRLAVEAGVGGSVSLRGRDRCEKAAAPKPAKPPAPKPARSRTPAKSLPTKNLGNSLQRPTISSVASQEAVKKLRAANAEAEKADDEKFALSDSVDAKLAAWRNGKTDNLRALLQSMDIVLWEGAGWKKVGMSDLVMPNKVKIVYMKAIAKVHPDKIPQDATTEQRMISSSVFSTLNEAWDKFKTENGL